MLAQENSNNKYYQENYTNELFKFGALDSVKSINDWKYKNIITVKDGKLVFSANSSWEITDNSNSVEINNFINSMKSLDGERHEISLFEEARRGLSKRMAD
jgi:septum formation inhibitor-activating ATPase MinD